MERRFKATLRGTSYLKRQARRMSAEWKWFTCRKHFRWRSLERSLMLLLVVGGVYLYLTLPDVHSVDTKQLEIPGLEHDVPIFFVNVNRSRPAVHMEYSNSLFANNFQFTPRAHGRMDNPEIQRNWLPQLLPKEDPPQMDVEKPDRVQPDPTPKPHVTPQAKPDPTPHDYLRPFRTGKSKVPINTLTTGTVSPSTWLSKLDISDEGSDEVTLVTSYINIGKYRNDDTRYAYTPDSFRRWMTAFCRILNPVVVFMNDDNDLNLFGNIRSFVPNHKTHMFRISKSNIWSFSLLPNISQIYKSWPKHNPFTTVPHYTSIAQAKYEFLAVAMKENPFKTKYFAWMDIGYFRGMAHPIVTVNETPLSLYLPPMLDQKKVAFGESHQRDEDVTPSEILKQRITWVSGSMFVGSASTMHKWVLQYVKYVNRFLQKGLIGVDQHVVHAMFQTGDKLDVDLQSYSFEGLHDQKHHLGFLCRDEGAKKLGNKGIGTE